MEYKVLITTSGIGSRLGDLTKYTNKSLVRIGNKPAISHIIENYPPHTKFVITLGHYGNHVRDFLNLAYTETPFEFVEIDKFEGSGSSLVYSISKTEELLQCPFIFHACDTLTTDEIPLPDTNWLGSYQSGKTENYRSLTLGPNHIVSRINEKGEFNYDYAYMGLAGIYDYKIFWEELKKILEERNWEEQLSDCHVINNMDVPFKCHVFKTWFDIGNSSSLNESRNTFHSTVNVLDKADESIFIFKDSVIKFFHNKKTVSNRVKRTQYLNNIVPKIIDYKENFYKYEYISGYLFSDIADITSFKIFLTWAYDNLWKKTFDDNFRKKCMDFYKTKTLHRILKFLDKSKIQDQEEIINSIKIPKISALLDQINWDWLCSNTSYTFHGDLILDNIIKTQDGFILLDWRQDFAGSLEHGDIYYDIAKLNHNLTINHKMIQNNFYKINIEKEHIICNIHLNSTLYDCKEVLHEFITTKGLDLLKVKIITPLIWLNMAPLHSHPFDTFLYYFGKYNLYKELKNVE